MNWSNQKIEADEALKMLSTMPYKYQVISVVDDIDNPDQVKYYLISKEDYIIEKHLIVTYKPCSRKEPNDDCEEVDKPEYHLRPLFLKKQSDAYTAKYILEDMIKKSGFITCSEYYDTCGRPTTQEDDEYGWIWNDHFQIKVRHSIYDDKKGPYELRFSTQPIHICSNFRDSLRLITEQCSNSKKNTLKVLCDFIMPNKTVANNVLQIAQQEIDRKGQISVKYYFELAASSTNCDKAVDYSDPKYEKYGWKKLDDVKIKKVKTGRKIIMPEAVLLN